MQLLQILADETDFLQPLEGSTDDMLIYQLKMRKSDKDAELPGLKIDYANDFKTALLCARGKIKE
ncbi:DUF1040 family protein [Erwinia amylovora]|uniref:Uncharacterized protein n=4 Tax=Erwinia amylovora TaxID=552 RepID=A0A831ERY5_ERWAM|nr:DUF1040 domain-containing protein [Erwinia amylovora]EKV55651.1 hypothetical protein EaACW_0028 [Erwinia amylovora ACW56400]CBA18968.1 Uncharacterized protein HI0845 (ORF1) [Erwinia amylovora CFBP1430]CBX78849.1 Uncharacterized protein HI0845 (ORF1) [Erwinia amylovora ATCC BAA-2158]CCO76876.1 hypothetical protein BN432_0028 [Erwinia amylovora Ea356]CCO80654.1 hypothetical protein BN433_0032 [Erwinia amylovora Ea266]CCO88250.1 hypothetical protein BN435_0027 [Erwinia amylovora 01SFR-BO]CCO